MAGGAPGSREHWGKKNLGSAEEGKAKEAKEAKEERAQGAPSLGKEHVGQEQAWADDTALVPALPVSLDDLGPVPVIPGLSFPICGICGLVQLISVICLLTS